jgi:hypothetical protein
MIAVKRPVRLVIAYLISRAVNDNEPALIGSSNQGEVLGA